MKQTDIQVDPCRPCASAGNVIDASVMRAHDVGCSIGNPTAAAIAGADREQPVE